MSMSSIPEQKLPLTNLSYNVPFTIFRLSHKSSLIATNPVQRNAVIPEVHCIQAYRHQLNPFSTPSTNLSYPRPFRPPSCPHQNSHSHSVHTTHSSPSRTSYTPHVPLHPSPLFPRIHSPHSPDYFHSQSFSSVPKPQLPSPHPHSYSSRNHHRTLFASRLLRRNTGISVLSCRGSGGRGDSRLWIAWCGCRSRDGLFVCTF
ncbi:hypothetical protein B0J14DRAFT_678767 [Halenospora varia]|nr:hypothetical protein B0J14DRAFT_678767 [Halenospora varia]